MSDAYYLRVEGLEELQDAFKKAGINFKPLMRQAMDKATTRVKTAARDNIRRNGTTFQGNLGRSIQATEVTAEKGVVAVGEGKYGPAVEFGRKAGKFPPVAPLERWAAIKLGVPGIGFVIARKIAREGTKAQPYLLPAFKSNAAFILKQFDEAAAAVVRILATQ